MVKSFITAITAAVLALILSANFPYNADAQIRVSSASMLPAVDSINRYLKSRATVKAKVVLDTILISDQQKSVDVRFRKSISDYPLRDKDIKHFTDIIRRQLPSRLRDYTIRLSTAGKELERLSSGFFSGRAADSHLAKHGSRWITPLSTPYTPEQGLKGKHIALWSGHGYYYSHSENRWKWQRAPFFSTIEDLLPYSYITQYLAPMLENAGAYVLMPRERDTQPLEIIIDNGDPFYSERNADRGNNRWKDAPGPGFSNHKEYLNSGENPFCSGTARIIGCDTKNSSSASYLPYFPTSGDYAVYVSYQTVSQSAPALYTVRHSGGDTKFSVDQSIGGGTWVYLGTFRFSKGETGQGVIVHNSAPESNGQGFITTDAVKFGGGMGNILRGSESSGFPRYAEAARYWLQWSGFPEDVYSLNNGTDDYRDDFMSRGEWVNSLINDFSVPVDMALALHTDAGAIMKDSIVGTLAIYKEESEGKIRYSDGTPRITARELSDIVQTSIVNDIRTYYRADWTRRAIWDRSYMEARVPDVPTVLIELLSHQNLSDMECALDPQFKFIVSRAIYKGILKYLSYVSGSSYTVQPLPVKNFSAVIHNGNNTGAEVRLRWSPRQDSSEPSAKPDSYIVYRRVTDPSALNAEIPGFDNGTPVTGTGYSDMIEPGKIYSYKIVAVNRGGVSFPSETLSAGYIPESKECLVVNGFTTVSPPASLQTDDSLTAGLDFRTCHGIPYISDISYIGEQYIYDRQQEWIHDDRPGFGASFMDYGPAAVAGNTFDYPFIHGLALMRSGVSFSSTSLDAFLSWENPGSYHAKYPIIDLIFGKENSGILTSSLRGIIEPYCSLGGSVIISGSGIGKSAAYEDRTYPEIKSLSSAFKSARSAAKLLSALKDTLTAIEGSGQATAGIDDALEALSSLSRGEYNHLKKEVQELLRNNDPLFIADNFAADVFRYGWSNGYATSSGMVRSVHNSAGLFADSTFRASFHTLPNPCKYCVESPDAILPLDDNSFTFMRYEGANTSAAVAYDGNYRCVSLGFPIEALTSQQQVNDLMREVIRFLLRY